MTLRRCTIHVVGPLVMRVQLLVATLAVGLLGALPAHAQNATPFPSTPVGAQLAWVLEVLNTGATTLTPADVSARFAPEFLGEAPAEQVVALTKQVAAAGPFAFEGFTRPPTATQAIALVTAAAGIPFVVPIAVAVGAPHQITGLYFNPVPPPPGLEIAPVVDAAGTPIPGAGRLDGLFDVGGGRRLYLSCVGAGSPTVVLESGGNDSAAPWFAVEQAVAGGTRVCSYDRANALAGASDPAPAPRTAQEAVADLHALLGAAGVPGPYVLVGHSLGGLIARLYAGTYPDEVAGLVLVDPSHEEQDARLEALVGPELWAAYAQVMARFPAFEGIDFAASFAQVRAARAAAPLRPMPLIVLTAGQPPDPAQFPPGWDVAATEQLHRELHADLASLVPNGRHLIAERSGHYVHQSQPELVVEAIRQVVAAVRDPSTWATPPVSPAATPGP